MPFDNRHPLEKLEELMARRRTTPNRPDYHNKKGNDDGYWECETVERRISRLASGLGRTQRVTSESASAGDRGRASEGAPGQLPDDSVQDGRPTE